MTEVSSDALVERLQSTAAAAQGVQDAAAAIAASVAPPPVELPTAAPETAPETIEAGQPAEASQNGRPPHG